MLAVDRRRAALDAAVTEATAAGGIARRRRRRRRRRGGRGGRRWVAAWRNGAAWTSVVRQRGRERRAHPLLEQTVEQWQEILARQSSSGPWLMIKHAAPAMIDPTGRRLDHLHRVGRRPRANAEAAPTAASKAGVVSLVQTAANALPRHRRPGQRHLPRADRDGHDPPHLRSAPARAAPSARIGQLNPLQRHRPARRDRRRRAASWPATSPPTSTVRPSRWTVGCPAPTPSRATGGDPPAQRLKAD